MTFEGRQYVGPQAIVAHLQSLGSDMNIGSFNYLSLRLSLTRNSMIIFEGQLAHDIPRLTVDVQPGTSPECLLIFTTG